MVFTTLVTSLIAPAAMANACLYQGPRTTAFHWIYALATAGTHLTLTSKTIEVPAPAVKSVNAEVAPATRFEHQRAWPVWQPARWSLSRARTPSSSPASSAVAPWSRSGPAQPRIGDVVESGQIKVNGAPDMAQAVGIWCGRDRPDASARRSSWAPDIAIGAPRPIPTKVRAVASTYSLAPAGGDQWHPRHRHDLLGLRDLAQHQCEARRYLHMGNQDLDMGIAGGESNKRVVRYFGYVQRPRPHLHGVTRC